MSAKADDVIDASPMELSPSTHFGSGFGGGGGGGGGGVVFDGVRGVIGVLKSGLKEPEQVLNLTWATIPENAG